MAKLQENYFNFFEAIKNNFISPIIEADFNTGKHHLIYNFPPHNNNFMLSIDISFSTKETIKFNQVINNISNFTQDIKKLPSLEIKYNPLEMNNGSGINVNKLNIGKRKNNKNKSNQKLINNIDVNKKVIEVSKKKKSKQHNFSPIKINNDENKIKKKNKFKLKIQLKEKNYKTQQNEYAQKMNSFINNNLINNSEELLKNENKPSHISLKSVQNNNKRKNRRNRSKINNFILKKEGNELQDKFNSMSILKKIKIEPGLETNFTNQPTIITNDLPNYIKKEF